MWNPKHLHDRTADVLNRQKLRLWLGRSSATRWILSSTPHCRTILPSATLRRVCTHICFESDWAGYVRCILYGGLFPCYQGPKVLPKHEWVAFWSVIATWSARVLLKNVPQERCKGVVFARAWCTSSLDVPQDFLKHHKHRKRYFFLRTAMLLAFQVPADSKCLALRDLGVSRALPTSLHEKLL